MGNALQSGYVTLGESQPSCKQTIQELLATKDDKLTIEQAMVLYNRYNTLVARNDSLHKNEPFKQHQDILYYGTSRPTSELRVIGLFKNIKIILFQFVGDEKIFIQIETLENAGRYAISENNLRAWLFDPSLRERHHLLVEVMKEEDPIDHIRFVSYLSLKTGILPT